MQLFLEVLSVLVGALGALLAASGAWLLVRRDVEPTEAEVVAAEAAAVETWQATGQSSVSGETSPLPASGDAEAVRILAEYAEDLRGEAERIANRAGSDSASAVHVRLAADRLGILRQRASALTDIGLATGALILGGTVSYAINLVTGGDAAEGSEPWVIGIGMFGLVIFVAAATVKWVKHSTSYCQNPSIHTLLHPPVEFTPSIVSVCRDVPDPQDNCIDLRAQQCRLGIGMR